MLNVISKRLMRISDNDLPFGGLSALWIGDFSQLHCIQDDVLIKDPSTCFDTFAREGIFIYKSANLKLNLKESVRQVNDKRFEQLLNNVRDRKVTTEDPPWWARWILAVVRLSCQSCSARCVPSEAPCYRAPASIGVLHVAAAWREGSEDARLNILLCILCSLPHTVGKNHNSTPDYYFPLFFLYLWRIKKRNLNVSFFRFRFLFFQGYYITKIMRK